LVAAFVVTAISTLLCSTWLGRKDASPPAAQAVAESADIETFNLSEGEDDALFDLTHLQPATRPAPSSQTAPDPARFRFDRRSLVRVEGPSAREAAISSGLQWIVAHQSSDGSWSFNHPHALCPSDCSCAGAAGDCRTGATALALMALQSAGQTHKEGKYKQNVGAGVGYLVSQMHVVNPADGTASRGNLGQPGLAASHALATLALCEEYGMTQDRGLLQPAQLAVHEIVSRQDAASGGWTAGRCPDMGLSGWNLLALKHGHLNYLVVPPLSVARAQRFFGAMNLNHSPELAERAIALRSRLLMGAKWSDPAVIIDAQAIGKIGYSDSHLAYNFFATQVMQDYGGAERDRWDEELKNWLASAQEKAGHDRGSWYFPADADSQAGGRLYCTTMATLILELRYRQKPLVCRQAVDDDFPL